MISFDQDSKNGMEEHDFSVVVVGAFPATVDGLVVVFCEHPQHGQMVFHQGGKTKTFGFLS